VNLILGFVFILGSIIASVTGKLDTATLFVVVACYYFLREDIGRIERKIK